MGYGPLSTQTQVARWQGMLAAINHFGIVHRHTKTRKGLALRSSCIKYFDLGRSLAKAQ